MHVANFYGQIINRKLCLLLRATNKHKNGQIIHLFEYITEGEINGVKMSHNSA